MKALIMTMMAATVALTGCNAMTATADKMMNKQSTFSQAPNTAYPIGEGPYDADAKKQAALVDMKATQAAGAQRPTGVKTEATPAGAQ